MTLTGAPADSKAVFGVAMFGGDATVAQKQYIFEG